MRGWFEMWVRYQNQVLGTSELLNIDARCGVKVLERGGGELTVCVDHPEHDGWLVLAYAQETASAEEIIDEIARGLEEGTALVDLRAWGPL